MDVSLASIMAWSIPQFSRVQVDTAGEELVYLDDLGTFDSEKYDKALAIINNWRSSHSRPLQIMKMTLLRRAQAVHGEALIAQRIKRIPAIRLKLKTNPGMKLSRMHDIGGCRAVMPFVPQVEQLVNHYE